MENLKISAHQWLRKSESFFKTDMVYAARGGFWLTAGQLLSTTSSFILAIAFANLLPKETYGAYRYILSVASLLTITTLSGINTAILQAVAQHFEGSVIPAFYTRIRWGFISAVASIAVGAYYYISGNTSLSISFLSISIFLPFTDAFTIYQAVLQGRGEFKKEAKLKTISSILLLMCMLPLLFLTDNLILLVITFFLFWFVINYLFFLQTKKNILNNNISPDAINYGKHLTVFGVLGEVASQIDKILLFHFLGAVGTAVYSIATAPVHQIRGLTKLIQLLIIPKASTVSLPQIHQRYWRKFITLLISLCAITLIYILVAPLLFKLFFPKYLEAVYLSQIFSLSLIGSVAVLNVSLLQSHKEKKALYRQSIVVAIFQIGSLAIGTIFAGVLGAAIAFIFARFIHAVYSTIQVHQLFKKAGVN